MADSYFDYLKELEEQRKQEEEEYLEYLDKLEKENNADKNKSDPLDEWYKENQEKDNGGFLGGLGYLGQSILNGIVGSAEGIVDYTVGGLASLFGGLAGKKYAEDLMENDWYDYEAAEKRFNPSIGWKVAGDVAGGLGQGAFSIGIGALTTLATGGAGLAPGIAKGIGVAADVATDFLSSAGRGVSSAVKDENADRAGLDYTDWLYGSGSGALEAGLGQLVPAAGKLGNKVLGKTASEVGSEITESVTKKIVKNVTSSKFTKEVLGEAVGEGIEETISAYLEPYIKRATYDSDAQNATIGDVLYSGFIGALTGAASSGTSQGIQLGANTLANTKRGSDIAADSKKTANLLQNASLISDYEAKKHTGASAFESVAKQYQKVVSSLESTGGVAVTAEQKRMLGELDAYVAQAVIQPNIVNAAKGVAYNAEAYADSLNKFYKKTGANQTVTAADLTAGLDMNGDSQAFVRSVSTAMESNGALRGVVLNNAIGQMEMDSRAYADSIFGDTSISTVASQENINRFVETADEDTIKSVENTLGVDMRTVTPEILAESIIRWRDSGAAAVYEGGFRDVQDAVNTLEFIDDLPSEYDIEPNTLESIIKGGNVQTSRIKEGVTRFTHGDTDIAIIKRGEGYRIYDYKSGKVSRTLTRSELSSIVRQLRNGGKTIEVIGKLVESAEGRVQSAELDALAMKSVPEYKNLLETEKMAVRETLRRAMANGVSEEDAILFGKISAKSGMNIVALNDADYKAQVKDDSVAKYDGKNTVYINVDAERSRTFSGLLGHEMWHKIFKTGKGKRLFMQAYDRLDKSTRSKVEEKYREDSNKLGRDEESIKEINRDEIAAAYAEELFHNAETWDYVLSEEPSFKDRVLSFFKGANKKYSFEPGMTKAAKKWLLEYKRLFNEVSAYNKGANAAQNAVASEGVRKIERIGRVVESGESAEFRTQNAELDDGSRSALKRGGSVASELAGLKTAVSELNIDPVNLMALSDKYFGRYDGKKSRTALRIELMDAARLMADSKDPDGLDKGYEAVLRLADDLVANEKDSSGYTEQMREIQKHIREIELQVHDRDKGDFDSYGGYEQFRKKNFGKLKLGTRGVEVDSAYAELQNLYGYDVFPEVNSIAEMADVMARVGEGATLLRGFEGDFDKQVDATAQQIYVELAEAISKGYPGKPKPRITRADAEKYIKKLDAKYEVKVARAKAKMEERASKAEAKYEKKTETKKVQLEAEYTTDKVFSQKSVKDGFDSVSEVKKLPGKERETIARDLWLELEASDAQDVRDTFILKYSVKLYDAIKNADYKAYENMTMKEKDALREKLNAAVKKIVSSGRKSKGAKIREDIKAEEQVAGEIKSKIYQSLKKIEDVKKERFLAASDYKSDEFKDTLEKLTKIDWRGKFSANIAREQVKKLSGWYSEENPMFKSEDSQGLNSSFGYSQSVKNVLDMLAEGEKDFSNRELLVLSDVIDYFTELITNYDKIYLEGKWVSGENVVYDIKETLERQSKTALPASTRRMRNELMGQTVFGDPLSVMKLADVYENGIFTRYYNEWQAGEIASAAEQARLEEKYNDFFSKKENRDYLKRAETETINLHGVEVRKIDYIEYCMTLKRKQALAGIESGGIVVRNAMKKGDGENVKIYPVNMIEKGPGYENRLETAVNAEYQRAIKKLSSKDLEYMKILEEGYELAREVKALGDLQRQGFVSVVEGYYYPIRRAYSDHLSEFDAAAFATDKYANAGFNKRQAADSNGALKIGSADDTFHRHIRGVSGYLHLSPVMDSFNKVYKLKVLKTRPGEGASIDLINDLKSMRNSTTSLQQLIDQSKTTWRDKDGTSVGFKYLQELMLDTMGKVPSGKLDEYAAKLRGGYVKFALGGNPKVLLTQLSSLMASTSVISKWSHVAGVLNSTANVDNYSIVAKLRYGDNTVLKAQGVIDTVNSKTDVFMKGIELFDRFVIKRAFAACQAEVAKTQGLKVGTEENLKAAGKLLDKVILETQQNSFASSKTAAARRGGALAKTLQMFKSDAVKITARILDAWGERAYLQTVLDSKEVSEDQKTKLRARLKDVNKNLGDAIVAAVMQAVYMGVVAELFRAIYGKLEKEEEPLEKAKRLGAEFLGNLIGGLPFYAELFSALTSSFSNIEAMEFSAINDLISTVNKVINTVGDAAQGEADFKEYVKMLESVTYSAGQILGIPFRNLKNVLSIPLNFLSDEARYRWDDIFDSKNYGADLKDAVAAGDLDLAVTILELAFKDRLGSGLSKKAINELARLAGIRDDMLPSAVGDTVTIDGEERELSASEINAIRDRYSDAVEQINKFIEGGFYDNLSDEDRAAAVKKIYTLFKELAIDTVLGTEKDKKAMILSKVVPAESLVLWEVAKVIDSDKDEDGNTVYGSKKKNLIEAIMAEQLSYEEKLLLIGMSDLTLNGGDIEGVTGIEARTTLYNYISSLENISDEERGELLKYCGFEDRDDNGTIDEPLPSDINNSYKSDLKDAVESGDTKSAEDIISLAVRENLGVDISKEAVKEIARLAATGKNVLPSVIEDSVKIGGKERELTAAEYKAAMKKYSVAAAEVDKLISSNIYKGLSDEQKASAVGSVFEMFRNIAYDSTLGTNKNAKAHVLSKVLPSSSLVIWDVAGAIDSDKDENGYTIDGSRKKNIIDAVMSESLSYEEKLLIIGANGCRINGGDIEGVTGFEARLTIYNYISKLKDISNEERYALYDYCGFVNDEGVLREPIPADIDTSYKKDLEEAISAGDAKSAENIVSLAIRESMGTEIGKETINEIVRLTGLGKNVLPTAISDKISYNGKTRELTVDEYKTVFAKASVASAQVEKLIESDVYKSLNDDQRASVVNSVFDMFKDIAYDTTLGTQKNVKAATLSKVVDPDALVLWKCSGVFEADRDENGKAISGSKKAKIVNAIWNSDIPEIHRLLLIGMNGYKIDDDDIPGLTGFEAQTALYNYIASLENLSEEERLELYKECGFEIEGGTALAPVAGSSSGSSSSSKSSGSKTIKKIGWVLGGGSMIGSMHGADYTKKIVKLGKVKN